MGDIRSDARLCRPYRRMPRGGSVAALLAALAILASVSTAAPARAAAPAEPFSMDLYAEGDFVSQTNMVQCVGASMQMMLNIMGIRDDRSAAWQGELQQLARRYSPSVTQRLSGEFRHRRGASSRGWATGLTMLGAGPYKTTSGATLDDAVRMAALAMRTTERPVGLLVWQGAHAWVMSGFEATADPLLTRDFEVTAVFVQDPLYPRSHRTHGPLKPPDTRVTTAQLARDFVPWRPNSSNSTHRNRFVIVMPFHSPRPASPGTFAF